MADKQQQFSELPRIEHSPETTIERESPKELQKGEFSKNDEQASVAISVPAQARSSASGVIMDEKSQMRRDIERILEEDLGDMYLTLNTRQRAQFRIEGEKTAAKIELILEQVKVKLITLINLIRQWLRLLPGVNTFFLEQEAKIKAEKLLTLKNAGE